MAVLVVNLRWSKKFNLLASSHHEHMPNKKSKKESGKVTLARVKKEMAEPRLARSVREGPRKGPLTLAHDNG
jgi:hypothetical protein